LASNIGRALEEVSRTTGSVAHFYRDVSLGNVPGNFRVESNRFSPEFIPIIQ